MRDLTHTEMVKLEELIDATSVRDVLEAISMICIDKSTHIRDSYSDFLLAEKWDKAGIAVRKVAVNQWVREVSP
jgi:hypothetical protein